MDIHLWVIKIILYANITCFCIYNFIKNQELRILQLFLYIYKIINIFIIYNIGLCLVCKNKYIYEKIIFKYPNLIDQEIFDLPIKENTIIFYPIHFKNYIFNFFYFFHYLFKCIYNSNLLVIIGSNGLIKYTKKIYDKLKS